jgi:hypothetical protein
MPTTKNTQFSKVVTENSTRSMNDLDLRTVGACPDVCMLGLIVDVFILSSFTEIGNRK